MTATDLPPARVRWYRRRPPEGMQRFPRAVWWAGHGQLFIGLALLVLGPVTFVVGYNVPGASSLTFVGLLMFAMAAPFAVSGRLLRAQALRLARSTHELWLKIVELAVAGLGIALLAFVFVFIDVFVLILLEYSFVGAMYAERSV